MVTKRIILALGIANLLSVIILCCANHSFNKDNPLARVLFCEDFKGNTLDTCIILTSQEALRKYTDINYDIDFNKNSVLLILKPWSSTYHEISYKNIKMGRKALIIRYIYEIINKEVEGPPKKYGLLIPKVNISIKIIEHNVVKEVEIIKTKETAVEN